jgi:hypothetical protein
MLDDLAEREKLLERKHALEHKILEARDSLRDLFVSITNPSKHQHTLLNIQQAKELLAIVQEKLDALANKQPPTPQMKSRPARLSASVICPSAVEKMDAHLVAKVLSLEQFAEKVKTTPKTLRSFRNTGKVRRDIFASIAKHMGTTPDKLQNPD